MSAAVVLITTLHCTFVQDYAALVLQNHVLYYWSYLHSSSLGVKELGGAERKYLPNLHTTWVVFVHRFKGHYVH